MTNCFWIGIEEVVRQCTIADVKIVVTFPLFLPIIQAVKSKIPIIKSIINVGEKEEGCHCFSEMVKVDPKGVELFSSSKVDTLNDIVMLPFSSGTTGPPKGNSGQR
jgi:4-coumarate--CoA ligase